MRILKLTIASLVLLIGLLPAGGGEAPGYVQAARMTEGSLAQVTPSVTQAEEAVSLPEGASAGWWAGVQEDIGRTEYQVTWQDHTYLPDFPAAYQAPNRAQNLRTYFTPEGIRAIPRTGDGATWEWGLTLTGYGYEGAIQPVAPATLSAEGDRIEYRRGGLTEWYVNDERGLEQGFTIDAPPVGIPGGKGAGYLVLQMAVTGDLSPSLTEDGLAIELTTQGGVRVLRYGSLYAEDAAGRRLPAYLAVAASTISVLVDDGSTIYPIVVDPLVTSPGWTAESDQVGTWFGISVGTAGDVNGDGYSDVIVGAPAYHNPEGDEGRVFVYHGSAAGLSATANWTAESDQVNAFFGISAGTAGDVNGDGYSDVIVGALFYNNGEDDEGGAFVYHGSAEGLSATADWTAESDQASAQFGTSVGTAGDVNGDGYSDVIVGADRYGNGQSREGRAFVYHGSATGLSATADWTAEGDQAGAEFGSSVGTAGDVNGDGYSDVIVGAYLYDNGETDEGRAFVYHGSATGLSVAADWTAESDQAGARFGHSVATAGDVNDDGYSDVIAAELPSRAFVYHGSATGLSATASWTAEGEQTDGGDGYSAARFTTSVGTAGDVNGDGYSDVIVGASGYDNGETDEGGAFVYNGSAAGLSVTANWTAESDQAGAQFGRSVGAAGDVNGDGYSDVIVGAYHYDNGESDEGGAFVYHGSAPDLPTPEALVEELIVELESLDLPKGIENSLVSKLQGALRSLERGKGDTAIKQLIAFINHVNAQSGKKIADADADDLSASAQQIIELVEGG